MKCISNLFNIFLFGTQKIITTFLKFFQFFINCVLELLQVIFWKDFTQFFEGVLLLGPAPSKIDLTLGSQILDFLQAFCLMLLLSETHFDSDILTFQLDVNVHIRSCKSLKNLLLYAIIINLDGQ